jgi:hypothetical protein
VHSFRIAYISGLNPEDSLWQEVKVRLATKTLDPHQFPVKPPFGRDIVIYREGRRKMAITADIGAGQANLFMSSIARWEDDPLETIGDETKLRIANNVKRALESQGLAVNLLQS